MAAEVTDFDAGRARAVARENRKAFRQSHLGPFAKAMQEAMREYAQMRGQGVSQDDALRGLEMVIREHWPGRTAHERNCSDCDGTGWRERVCQHRVRCGRYRCAYAEPSWEHGYAEACQCPAGDSKRKRVQAVDDELASIGRKQKAKPRGFTRI